MSRNDIDGQDKPEWSFSLHWINYPSSWL